MFPGLSEAEVNKAFSQAKVETAEHGEQKINMNELGSEMEHIAVDINEQVIDSLKQGEKPASEIIRNIADTVKSIDVEGLEKIVTAMKNGTYNAVNQENLINLQRAYSLASEVKNLENQMTEMEETGQVRMEQGGLTEKYKKTLNAREELNKEIFNIFKDAVSAAEVEEAERAAA